MMLSASQEIQIKLKIGKGLERYWNETPEGEMRVAPGTRIGDIVRMLAIPEGEIGVVGLNGVLADKDAPLHSGDTVMLYPPIGGGV